MKGTENMTKILECDRELVEEILCQHYLVDRKHLLHEVGRDQLEQDYLTAATAQQPLREAAERMRKVLVETRGVFENREFRGFSTTIEKADKALAVYGKAVKGSRR